jgi:hypothetical protein
VTTEPGRRLHPEDGWWQPEDGGWYTDDRASLERPADNPFRTLPARVAPEDLVAEVDVSTAPHDPTTDPNREIAARWGAGLVGFA